MSINTNGFLIRYIEEVNNQENDKEYQLYLKLKEKYEGKE